MKREVILDTNFIISCLRQKIDFLEAGEFGKIVIPAQVVDELKNLTIKGKVKDRDAACLALGIINKKKIKKIKLDGKFVDSGIKKYTEKNMGVIVATLDRELKKNLKGKAGILVIRNMKKLELI